MAEERNWFLKQWDDIKGNVKYGLLMAILAGLGGLMGIVLKGLTDERRFAVSALFILVILWAAVATWGHRWQRQAAPDQEMLSPLQKEILRLVRDLGDFAREIGPKPQAEKRGRQQSSEDLAEFLVRQVELERPWQAKLVHGYAGRFAPRVKSIMHQLGEKELDTSVMGKYAERINSVEDLQKLLERLYYAILELEPNPFPEA
jgi:hypothetical protein